LKMTNPHFFYLCIHPGFLVKTHCSANFIVL
jgi:hypothetical protein